MSLERRILAYCAIDTPSDPDTPEDRIPSTDCQWELLQLLERELLELGASEVELTERGYLIATLPGNRPAPVVALCAHVDTSAQFCATGVRPQVHRSWNGEPIQLGEHVLRPEGYLATRKGHDIVTASGNSLLGADDKAGVAIAMTVAEHLLRHPEIPRGDVRVCFSPDEEIGRGAGELPLDRLRADVAYTLDGAEVGELCYETFSADKAIVEITGVSVHPGWAKDQLVNALLAAGQILRRLEQEPRPETTDGRQGFLHVTHLQGSAHHATMTLILRDFDLDGLQRHREALERACHGTGCEVSVTFKEQYRNMRYALEQDMRPVEIAAEAYRRCGIEPRFPAFRGGTDGSILTARGLPTPNLFCGMQNVHGPLEWVSLQDMQQAVEVCLELVQLWSQRTSQ